MKNDDSPGVTTTINSNLLGSNPGNATHLDGSVTEAGLFKSLQKSKGTLSNIYALSGMVKDVNDNGSVFTQCSGMNEVADRLLETNLENDERWIAAPGRIKRKARATQLKIGLRNEAPIEAAQERIQGKRKVDESPTPK